MSRYVVTVNPPIFASVEAPDPESAKAIVSEWWREQRVFEYIENAIDRTPFYIGDVDLFDSDDTTVELDDTDPDPFQRDSTGQALGFTADDPMQIEF